MVELPQLWVHDEPADALRVSPSTLHYMNYMRTGPTSYKVVRYRRYLAQDVLDCFGRRALEPDEEPEPRCRSPTWAGGRKGRHSTSLGFGLPWLAPCR